MRSILVLCLLSSISLHAQRDRYRFAASYFGVEGEWINENQSFSYFNSNGVRESGEIASSFSPRILIGGTHFWGHADFYISLPVASLFFDGNDALKHYNGVLTGFRAFPFALKNETIRPFLGVGFNAKALRIAQGPFYTNWQWFYEGGLNYRFANKIIGFEARYYPKTKYEASISRTDIESIDLSPLSFSVSYKKVIDFTAGYSSKGSKRYMKRVFEIADERGAYSAFSFGFGLSALIPLGKTELASQKAFFNDEISGNVPIDVGVGYFSQAMNASFRTSYRPLKQSESAHEYLFKVVRHSLAFEAFKFIGDYHGFVPFIGPYVSVDRYQVTENDAGVNVTDFTTNKMGYGLVFGWDIKQTKADYLTLRTNLRYTPELNYKTKGYKFTAEQLEFNFIQLVFYPERYKIYKQLNQK